MSRLPTPGGDDGSWGNVLNDILNVSLNSDGTLKANSVTNSQISAGSGSNGQILTKDSAQTSGIKWAAAPGGAGTLAGNTDVAIASPNGGEVLTYNNLS